MSIYSSVTGGDIEEILRCKECTLTIPFGKDGINDLQEENEAANKSVHLYGESAEKDYLLHSLHTQGEPALDNAHAIDVDSENSAETWEETPLTVLVDKVCKAILPSHETVMRSGGVKKWNRKASLVLTLASRVGIGSDSLHFLSFCRDFVTFLISFKVDEGKITALNDLAKDTNDPLSSEKVFDFIINLTNDLKLKEKGHQRLVELDEFICTYIGFCLAAGLDTPLLAKIFRTMCKDTGDLLYGSRLVILHIFKNDIEGKDPEESYAQVCGQLILNGELNEDVYPHLCLIDSILKTNEKDCHLAAVCCDVANEVIFKYVTSAELGTIESTNHRMLTLATIAVLNISNKEECSLKLVVSAAFVRAFITASAELLNGRPIYEFDIDGNSHVFVTVLNDLLSKLDDTGEGNGRLLLKKCLFTHLRNFKSLHQLRNWCDEMPASFQNVRAIEWQKVLLPNRLGYNPLAYAELYRQALDAILAVQRHQNRRELQYFIRKAKSSSKYRIGLLAAIVDQFYPCSNDKQIQPIHEGGQTMDF